MVEKRRGGRAGELCSISAGGLWKTFGKRVRVFDWFHIYALMVVIGCETGEENKKAEKLFWLTLVGWNFADAGRMWRALFSQTFSTIVNT